MLCNHATSAARSACRSLNFPKFLSTTRDLATIAPVNPATRNHKIVVVGGGSAGLSISHQLFRTGEVAPNDVAIIDPAVWHHYQPGWTLVGGGLKTK